jgi:hypothetical protein
MVGSQASLACGFTKVTVSVLSHARIGKGVRSVNDAGLQVIDRTPGDRIHSIGATKASYNISAG